MTKPLTSVRELLPGAGAVARYVNDDNTEFTVPVIAWAWIGKPGRAQIVALVADENGPSLRRADDWTNFVGIGN